MRSAACRCSRWPRALAVTAAWAIVWAQTPGPARVKFMLTAFVVASATTTWSLRAQVLSLLLVTVTMALLRRRRYGWLPVVFWFWANLHGAVLLGVLLLGAGLVAVLVEEIDAFPRLVLVSALCVLATSLTPLGWQFWLDMPRSLGRIRQLGIDEWAAPRLASLSLLPFWVTIGALTGLTAARGRALLRDPIARAGGTDHDLRLRARARSARADRRPERAAVSHAGGAGARGAPSPPSGANSGRDRRTARGSTAASRQPLPSWR